jgi:adenylate kinase family enzyme
MGNEMRQFGFSYKRIILFGTTGVGKTTLANQIATEFSLPLIDMDSLFRVSKNAEFPLETFSSLVSNAIQGDLWVMDGSYSEVQSITWPRAEVIVWLDFPLPFVIWGLFKRSLWRIFFRKSVKPAFYQSSEKSSTYRRTLNYFLAIMSHYRRQRHFFSNLYNTRYGNFHIIRLQNYQEAELWVTSCITLPIIDQRVKGLKSYEDTAHHR